MGIGRAGRSAAEEHDGSRLLQIRVASMSAKDTNANERAEAASMRATPSEMRGDGQGGAAAAAALGNIPVVKIDPNTVQKYVLVEARAGDVFRLLVRGDCRAAYHKDVARPLVQELASRGVAYEVLGGGRIQHTIGSIRIFGFSHGFPWKDGLSRHAATADVLRKAFPGQEVTWTDEGY